MPRAIRSSARCASRWWCVAERRRSGARLLLSTVSLVQGDTEAAYANAEAAVRGFRRLGRVGSLALARYARVQAKLAAG